MRALFWQCHMTRYTLRTYAELLRNNSRLSPSQPPLPFLPPPLPPLPPPPFTHTHTHTHTRTHFAHEYKTSCLPHFLQFFLDRAMKEFWAVDVNGGHTQTNTDTEAHTHTRAHTHTHTHTHALPTGAVKQFHTLDECKKCSYK
jgi:hypothetical protein